jgi:hypothetical protein
MARKVRRISFHISAAAILGVTFAVSIAAVAAADPVNNHRFPVDNSFLNMTGVTGVCSFPINTRVVTSRQYVVKTSTASDGTVTSRITGSLVLAITNAATGATMTVNIGGPGTVVAHPDGSVTSLSQGHFFTVNHRGTPAADGGPGFLITTGNTIATYNAFGNITSLSVRGATTNVCSLLS